MSLVDFYNKGTYRVFVLVDPRDPTDEDGRKALEPLPIEPRLPRWVGYGPGFAPWKDLWDFRENGEGPLFDWFRDLDANGLEPMVSRFPLWRISILLDHRAARDIARTILALICRLYGPGDDGPYYPSHPPFLLNPRIEAPDTRKPIIAETADGEILRFESVGEAVEHGFTRSAIYESLSDGSTYRGLIWRYADGVEPGRLTRPVERLSPEGQVESFPSVGTASRAVGLSRATITRLIETAGMDSHECQWRDAAV